MQILRDTASAAHFIHTQKQAGKTVGLVPTMGALHKGHLDLVERCRNENDVSVASVFVNPIQFNNSNDLAKYPRTLETDTALLDGVGCHAVFCPTANDMYPVKPRITLDFGALDKILEGQFRPGHFSGVGIVVSKLFNILQPDAAYFGLKDYQQFLVVTELVRDFGFHVKLVGCEIVREPDGLAMSSRNQRLSPEDRLKANLIYQVLQQSKTQLGKGDLSQIKSEAEQLLQQQNIRLEYLELANRDTLEILTNFNPSVPSILLMAAYVGEIRLIDNLFV
jgi:pantoate--beta-alanine ligase